MLFWGCYEREGEKSLFKGHLLADNGESTYTRAKQNKTQYSRSFSVQYFIKWRQGRNKLILYTTQGFIFIWICFTFPYDTKCFNFIAMF